MTTGGSNTAESVEIEVEQAQVPVGEAVEAEMGGEETSDALNQVSSAMVEVSATMIGKLAVMITRIPEMAFDESELQQLKDLWTPLMPTMSPVLGAVIGTLIIVTGKVGIYYAAKGDVKHVKRAAEEKSDEIPPGAD